MWAAGAHAALPLTSLSQRGGFVNELADISRPKTPLIPSDTPCDKETSFSVDFPSARLCQEILQVNLLWKKKNVLVISEAVSCRWTRDWPPESCKEHLRRLDICFHALFEHTRKPTWCFQPQWCDSKSIRPSVYRYHMQLRSIHKARPNGSEWLAL